MKRIILDCDPGHDDMVAIMLASAYEEIELLGITTVAGNQTGEKTFNNALKVLTLIKEYNIPVSRGFDKPILRPLMVAPQIHGVSGLDGANLPKAKVTPTGKHAVDFITETLLNSREKVYLVPTGPLTNIAISLIKTPEIKEKIERIVLMGGAVFDSNITPAAEFNIVVDPEAAKIVFESGLPITMVGLDVTNKSLFTFKDIEKLKNLGGPVSGVVGPLLEFFAKTNLKVFNINGAPLHDPLTIAYLIDNSVIETEKLHVDIETKGEFTSGRTVVDVYKITGKEPNVDVALKVNVNKFKEIVFEAIKKLDSR